MKKYHLKKSIARLRHVSLSPEERADARTALASLVAAVPPASYRPAARWHWNAAAATLAAFSVVVFLGAGVSFAAEGTLPGDILYPIKISITEPLRAKLAPSPEARAEWEVERTERRLLEAEQLATQTRLSDATEQQLSEAIAEHTRVADVLADSLDNSGEHKSASVVRSKLEALLNVHSEVTASVDSSDVTSDDSKESFAKSIDKKVKEVRAARNRAEDSLTSKSRDRVQTAADDARLSAQGAIDKALQSASKRRSQLPASAVKKIDEHIAEAQKLYREAEKKLGEGEFGDAFKKFTASLRAAHEAQVMAATSLRVDAMREKQPDDKESDASINETIRRSDDNDRDDDDDDGDNDSRDSAATSSTKINVNVQLRLLED